MRSLYVFSWTAPRATSWSWPDRGSMRSEFYMLAFSGRDSSRDFPVTSGLCSERN